MVRGTRKSRIGLQRTGSAGQAFHRNPQILLGAHMSIRGGASMAIERARSIRCTAMQMFVKNNMQWFARPLTREEIRAFLNHIQRGELLSVFGHANYLINLAATNPQFHANSIRALAEELVRSDQLELPFLVLHPGAHLGAGEEAGLQKIVDSIDEVFRKIPKVKTKIALEVTAGQGSCVGHRFEHLAHIIKNVREPDRLRVCLDTAHLFAAGYEIGSESGEENIPRIRSHHLAGAGSSCCNSRKRFEDRPRFASRPPRPHRQRPDRSGRFPLHHAKRAIP
jgi:deoxyribonuclease IV